MSFIRYTPVVDNTNNNNNNNNNNHSNNNNSNTNPPFFHVEDDDDDYENGLHQQLQLQAKTETELLERLAQFTFRHQQDKVRMQMLEQSIVKQQHRIDVLESTVESMAKKDQGVFKNSNIFGHLVQDNILVPTTTTTTTIHNNNTNLSGVVASCSGDNNNSFTTVGELIIADGTASTALTATASNVGSGGAPLPPPRRTASTNPRHRSLSVVTTEIDKTQIDQAVLVRRNEALQDDMRKQVVSHIHSDNSHKGREKELEQDIERLEEKLRLVESDRHSLSGRVADMILTQRAATNLQNLLCKVKSQRATRLSCLLRLEAAERDRMASHDDLSYTYRHDPSTLFLASASTVSKHNNNTRAIAPRGDVVIVFTDIFDFSSVAASHGDFAAFVSRHYLATTRECARLCGGYEIARLEQNSEIIAHCFSNAIDAVLFAAEVQLRMIKQAWPETMLTDPKFASIRSGSSGSSAHALIFSGPKIRSGIHIANLATEFDEVSCSMKYRGEGLAIAAMTAARARPGEILITQQLNDRMKQELGPSSTSSSSLSSSSTNQNRSTAILEGFFTTWCSTETAEGANTLIVSTSSSNENNIKNNNEAATATKTTSSAPSPTTTATTTIKLISVVPPPLHEGRRSWWKSEACCQSIVELSNYSPEFARKFNDPLIWAKLLGIPPSRARRLVVCGSKTQKSNATVLEKKKLKKSWSPLEEADFEIHQLRAELQKQQFMSAMTRRSLEGYERSAMWEHDFYERAAEKPPEGTIGLAFVRIHQQDKITNEINADVMTDAVRNYHAQIRQACRRNRGYLVKRDGEMMMVAFPSLPFMLDFSAQLHANMLSQVEWNAEFDQHQATCSEYQDDDMSRRPIMRGLRCCIAMNLVQPTCERDPVTLRMEYLGPSVQILAQVVLHARGGESLIGEDGFQAARKAGLLGEKSQFAIVPRGLKAIPGVRRPEMVYAILPRQLNARFNIWIRADQDEASGVQWKPREIASNGATDKDGKPTGGSKDPKKQQRGSPTTPASGRRGASSTATTSASLRAGSARPNNSINNNIGTMTASRNTSPDRARTALGGARTGSNNSASNRRGRSGTGKGGKDSSGGKDGKGGNNDDLRQLTTDMHVVASVPNDTAHLVSRVGKLLTHYDDAGVANVTAEQAGTLRAVRRLKHEKQRLEKAFAATETSMMMLHDESGLLADVPYLGRAAVVLLDAPGLEKFASLVGEAIKQKAFLMYRQVINDKIDLYDGYRVKHNGEDGFMVVFRDVSVALQFCLEIQTGLLHCNWPVDLSKIDPTLRVREAKHYQHHSKDSSNTNNNNIIKQQNATNDDDANNNNNDAEGNELANHNNDGTTISGDNFEFIPTRKQQAELAAKQKSKNNNVVAYAASQQQLLFAGIRCRAGIALGDVHTQFDPFTRRTDYSSGPVAFMAYRTCQAAFPGEVCITSDVMKELYKIDLNIGGGLLHYVKVAPKSNFHTNVDDGIPLVSGEAARMFSVLPGMLSGRANKFPSLTGPGSGSGGAGSSVRGASSPGRRRNEDNNINNNNKEVAFPRRRLTLEEVMMLTREMWWRQVANLTTPIMIQRLRRSRHSIPSIVVAEFQPQLLQQQQQFLYSAANNGVFLPQIFIGSGAGGAINFSPQSVPVELSPNNKNSSATPMTAASNQQKQNNNNNMNNITTNLLTDNSNSNSMSLNNTIQENQSNNNNNTSLQIYNNFSFTALPTAGQANASNNNNSNVISNTSTLSKLQLHQQNVIAGGKQAFNNNNNNNNNNKITTTTSLPAANSTNSASSNSNTLRKPTKPRTINPNSNKPGETTSSNTKNNNNANVTALNNNSYTENALMSNTWNGSIFSPKIGPSISSSDAASAGGQQYFMASPDNNNYNNSNNNNNNNAGILQTTITNLLSSGSPSAPALLQQHSSIHHHASNNNNNNNNTTATGAGGTTTYHSNANNNINAIHIAQDLEGQVVPLEDMCRNVTSRVDRLAEIIHSASNPIDRMLSPVKLALELEHVLHFARTLFAVFLRSGVFRSRQVVGALASLTEPVEASYVSLMRTPFSFDENPLRRITLDALHRRSAITCINCGLSLTDFPFCPRTGATHDRTTRFFGYRPKDNQAIVLPTLNDLRRLLDDIDAIDTDSDGRITLPQLQTMLAWNGEFIDEISFAAITASSPEARSGQATADDLLTVRPVDLLRALYPTLREHDLYALIEEARAGTPSEGSEDDEVMMDVSDDEENLAATAGPSSSSSPPGGHHNNNNSKSIVNSNTTTNNNTIATQPNNNNFSAASPETIGLFLRGSGAHLQQPQQQQHQASHDHNNDSTSVPSNGSNSPNVNNNNNNNNNNTVSGQTQIQHQTHKSSLRRNPVPSSPNVNSNNNTSNNNNNNSNSNNSNNVNSNFSPNTANATTSTHLSRGALDQLVAGQNQQQQTSGFFSASLQGLHHANSNNNYQSVQMLSSSFVGEGGSNNNNNHVNPAHSNSSRSPNQKNTSKSTHRTSIGLNNNEASSSSIQQFPSSVNAPYLTGAGHLPPPEPGTQTVRGSRSHSLNTLNVSSTSDGNSNVFGEGSQQPQQNSASNSASSTALNRRPETEFEASVRRLDHQQHGDDDNDDNGNGDENGNHQRQSQQQQPSAHTITANSNVTTVGVAVTATQRENRRGVKSEASGLDSPPELTLTTR